MARTPNKELWAKPEFKALLDAKGNLSPDGLKIIVENQRQINTRLYEGLRALFYDNQSEGAFEVWRVRVDGGTPERLIDHARMPVVSPDNQFIAFRHYPDGGPPQIGIMPWQSAQATKSLPSLLPIPIRDWQRIQWTPDGRALTFVDVEKGVANIWKYDLASGLTTQLTNFGSDLIFAYAWSSDFKYLACLRGTETRNVTLISTQK